MSVENQKQADAELCHELRNGGGSDLATQSRALARILDKLADIPTRGEVREMVHNALSIHSESCASARGKAGGGVVSKLKLSKGEVEGQGWGVASLIIIAVLAALILALSIPHVAQWFALWKGGSP